jgi:Holliday junction resolvase RusA-like endonuclease
MRSRIPRFCLREAERGELLVSAEFPGLPPSVNNIWKPYKSGIYKNPAVNRWQSEAVWILRKSIGLPVKTYEGDVSYLLMLMLSSKRKRDADNCVKALQDCLQISGVIKDDSQVKDHRVIMTAGKPARTLLYLWADSRLPAEDVEEIAATY